MNLPSKFFILNDKFFIVLYGMVEVHCKFDREQSVPKAIGMTGQKLCGIPVMVQPSEAEKNRLAEEAALELE